MLTRSAGVAASSSTYPLKAVYPPVQRGRSTLPSDSPAVNRRYPEDDVLPIEPVYVELGYKDATLIWRALKSAADFVDEHGEYDPEQFRELSEEIRLQLEEQEHDYDLGYTPPVKFSAGDRQ